MGMRDAFKNAAQAAFIAAGDIREDVVYRSKTNASSSYNPVTGLVTDAYTDHSVKMIINFSESKQNDGRAILALDCDCMIPVDNLTPTPILHDQILRNSDTEIWDIIWFKTDPAKALWTFQIRKL
jgi:hypothetical protein